MFSGSYSQLSSGLLVPGRNGYANRVVIPNTGSGSLVLPPWAKQAKVVLIGAGGSGAAAVVNFGGSSGVYATAGGGGPLVTATLNLDDVGRTLNYVIGAGGASPSATQAASTNSAVTAGNAGSVSSVVCGSRTLTANPGQGGKAAVVTTYGSSQTGGLGGTGVGGDLNFSGGVGGGIISKVGLTISDIQVPGGGSSGRPWGPGFKGGCFADAVDPPSGAPYMFAGASWGFSGEVVVKTGLAASTYLQQVQAGGHGCLSRGNYGTGGNYQTNATGGVGDGVFPSGSAFPPTVDTFNAFAPRKNWWDVDEICGYGASFFTYIVGSTAYYDVSSATEGGSGLGLYVGGGAFDTLKLYAGCNGGFGGGGGGAYLSNSIQSQKMKGGDGGVGAGGGAGLCQVTNNSVPYYSAGGKGGDGWLGVWFN